MLVIVMLNCTALQFRPGQCIWALFLDAWNALPPCIKHYHVRWFVDRLSVETVVLQGLDVEDCLGYVRRKL